MKIIEQSSDIIGVCPSPIEENMKRIELVGRTCYQSQDKVTAISHIPFCDMLFRNQHGAMLEHSNAVFSVKSHSGHFTPLGIQLRIILTSKFLRTYYGDGVTYIGGNYRAWAEQIELDHLDKEQSITQLIWRVKEWFSDYGIEVQHTPTEEIPKELHRITVRFKTNRAMCYDDITEVLTKDGWKLFTDVSLNDEFLTFNTDSILYEKPSRIINTPFTGEMITGASSMVDFCVTPNHRMYWFHYDSRVDRSWKINLAEDIEGKRVKFQRGLPFDWIGDSFIDEIPLQSSLYFARFMGVFITDGCISNRNGNGGKIILAQTKEVGRVYIKKVLEKLSIHHIERPYGFEVNNSKLHAFLLKYFPKTTERRKMVCRVPNWIKQAKKEYIEAFIEGVIVGDGNVHPDNGHKVIYTSNRALAGDYQECILKIGLCSTLRTVDRRGDTHEIAGKLSVKKNIEYIVSITERTNEHLFPKHHWGRLHYNGNVHCVTIPSGVLYVRRNGKCFWSGNSHEIVRHRDDCSFGQLSQRYVKHTGNIEFITPVNITEKEFMSLFEKSCEESEKKYQELLKSFSPQQARNVLTNAVSTEIYVTTNTEEWKHIFKLRCAKSADPQMQALMCPVRDEFQKLGFI